MAAPGQVDQSLNPQELARRSSAFMEGAKKSYDESGDMWFFELYHHLDDCKNALLRDHG